MGNIGEGIVSLFIFMGVLIILFVPLGIWKAIELLNMIHISVGLK